MNTPDFKKPDKKKPSLVKRARNLSRLDTSPFPEEENNPFTDGDDKLMGLADVFFYSKRPNGTKFTATLEESHLWESFFDPQHTFGPFNSEISKPKTVEYYFKGRWPLDYEDVMGVAPNHLRKSLARQSLSDGASIMSAVEDDAFLFSAVPNPTPPNMKHLRLLAHIEDDDIENDKGDMVQVEIAPCPSISLETKDKHNEMLLKERQALFDMIQNSGFKEELDGTCFVRTKGRKASRIQRQLKADKNETIVDMPGEELQDVKQPLSVTPSVTSFLEFQEKVVDKQQTNTMPCRKPLVCFILGFLFPPMWILGFTFIPKFSVNQTEANRDSEKKWSKYSRNAFCIFICLAVASAITIMVIRPQSIGFRRVETQDSKEGIVVF
ncbi:unnamed protein product [Rhizopus stolonifer]